MSKSPGTSTIPFTVNVSVIALVVFLCGVLYFFGQAMSGGTPEISKSVAGAQVIDSRDVAN
ncbi:MULTISPECIES: hypothetical protein [unclassified Rhizobium]|jgi:hypothetical protein|uniref:hypothetical protein n=1 Tax=unclassified Rhizobium TaxID=2613769 RepID=UPI000DD7ABAB|nr:hypothetical protein [Rhizobium sp. AN80A]